jgi:tetratricopeptide (TPR) repeat protein
VPSPLRPLANPPNPWATTDVEYLDGETPLAELEVYEDQTRGILARNDSPDVGFDWSVNPYRGCFHSCAYCYARPTHEYLSFGAGTDFDRKIVVKKRAAELLREAFDAPKWEGALVVFSGVTDCYQPLEASYRLTRGCLEVCAEYRNPVGIITKALELDPQLPLAHSLLGEVALAGEHLDVAVAEFEKERTRNPLDASIYDRLGDAYSRAGDYTKAQQSLQRALLLEPNSTGPYILLGKVLLKRQDPASALMYLERAEKMDSSNYITHSLLGQAYRSLGRAEDASRENEISHKIQAANEPKLETLH